MEISSGRAESDLALGVFCHGVAPYSFAPCSVVHLKTCEEIAIFASGCVLLFIFGLIKGHLIGGCFASAKLCGVATLVEKDGPVGLLWQSGLSFEINGIF